MLVADFVSQHTLLTIALVVVIVCGAVWFVKAVR